MTAPHHPTPPGGTPPNGTARHASGSHRPLLTTLGEAAHLRDLAGSLASSQETDAAEAPPSEPSAHNRAMAHLERRVGRVEGGISALLQSQARQLEIASAQGASNRALAVLLRVGLALLAAIGAAAPLLSETVRSNPSALGPYGAVLVAIVVAVARVAQPRVEAPPGPAPPDRPA